VAMDIEDLIIFYTSSITKEIKSFDIATNVTKSLQTFTGDVTG